MVARRGEIIEAWHPFSAVWLDAAGGIAWGPPLRTPFRSACKPLQAEVCLAALPAPLREAVLGRAPWLAIASASHSGAAEHVATVDALAAALQVERDDLRCGAHPPLDAAAAEALYRAGGQPDVRHNNCSGKHTLMVAAARALGAPRDYLRPDHPLQRRIRAHLERLTGEQAQLATDGCGVPTFAFSLEGIARAWRCLALAMAETPRAPLGLLGAAIARHPELTSGRGRLDLELVRAARVPIAVKVGAQGLFCVALPGRRAGLAVKVHSGAVEALPAAVTTVLAHHAPEVMGDAPRAWPLLEIRNVVGDVVGGYDVLVEPLGRR